MKLKPFFQLIRWKNLVLIAGMQYLLKISIFDSLPLQDSFTDFHFILLILTTTFITAAGYIINDIVDEKIDLINKPEKVSVNKEVSIQQAKKWYKYLNLVGIILGITLSISIKKPQFALYFMLAAWVLNIYSKRLKGTFLIGNIIVSLLLVFSIFIVPFLYFSTVDVSSIDEKKIYNLINLYMLFAFAVNMIREIVKDIEDVNGDHSEKLNTLPIVLGRKTAKKIAIVLTIATIILLFTLVIKNQEINSSPMIYTCICILLPLLFSLILLSIADKKSEYKRISNVLKFIILTGIISIYFL